MVGARSTPVRPKPTPRAGTLVITLDEPVLDNYDVCELRFRPLEGTAPEEAVRAVVAALEAGTAGVSRPDASEPILQQGRPWTLESGIIILTAQLPASLLNEADEVQAIKGGLPVEGVDGGLAGVAFSADRRCRRKIRVVNVPPGLQADTIKLILQKQGLQPTACERPRMGGIGFRECSMVEAEVVARMSDLPDKLRFEQPGGKAFECPIHYIRPSPPPAVGAVVQPRTVVRHPARGPPARAGATPSTGQPPRQRPATAAAHAGSGKEKKKAQQKGKKRPGLAAAALGKLAEPMVAEAEGLGMVTPAEPADGTPATAQTPADTPGVPAVELAPPVSRF